MRGSSAYSWGGFIGWVKDAPDVYFNNCLFHPAQVTINNDGSKTFARGNGIHVSNCYYKHLINDAQGATDASSMSNTNLRAALGNAWEIVTEDGVEKVVPVMELRDLNGEGTEASPYLIATVEDWEALSINVMLGETYSGKYFMMTDDISVTNMVGTNKADGGYNAFQGTFDGNGHTLTFTANMSEELCAPFRYVMNATIKNLRTTGTITPNSNKMAGGIAGRTYGTTVIINCISSMEINSSKNGDGTHGGLVANVTSGTLNLTGSVFNGSLLGSSTTHCGGLVGWTNASASVNITNCLFAPVSVTMSADNSSTIARYGNNNGYFTNCYYTQAFGTAQGKQIYSIAAAENINMQLYGIAYPYNVSGLTIYGECDHGFEWNDGFFAASGDYLELGLSYYLPGYTATGYLANGDAISWDDLWNCYALTMPAADVTITATITAAEWEGDGNSWETAYLIWNKGQLDMLASRVNGGNDYSDKYFKVMADITYTYTNASNNTNFTPIGNSNSKKFNGHFDGQNYTISGIRNKNGDQGSFTVKGLFGYLGSGAEVKNIVLTNTQFYMGRPIGAIAGNNEGIVTNCHVTSDVEFRGTMNYSYIMGGIVGTNESTGTVSHCTFAGTIDRNHHDFGNNNYEYGGIVGGNYGTLTDNFVYGATIYQVPTMYGQDGERYMTGCGAISGHHHTGNIARNYYTGCTMVTNEMDYGYSFISIENVTGVGSGGYIDFYDLTDNDGAVPGNKIVFLNENITSDAATFTIPAHGDVEEQTFSVAAFDATVTLGYEPSCYIVTYDVNDAAIEGNTFTMPDEYVEGYTVYVDVTETGITKTISGYANSTNPDGGYTLIASPVGAVNPENVAHMLDNEFDLYRFNQAADLEWENWEQEESDNYHFDLEAGHGYLYANSQDVTLLFPGTPYSGSGEVTLSKTDNINADFPGWNLVGNPFAKIAYIEDGRSFYTMNGDGDEIIAAEANSIAPMEGIFVIANTDGETMTFTTEAPANNGGAKLSLNLSRSNNGGVSTGSTTAVIDRAIVRFGEGSQLPKFQIRDNSTKVMIPQDGTDYAVVNAGNEGELPVSFKAKENGTYTLSLSSEGVEFSYLHLVDNMTGNDVDLLAGASTGSATYTFNAKTTDYESRFKLVFVANGEDGPSTGSGTFAFNSNGSWIISNEGEATLQVIDLNGRILSSETVNGSVSKAVNAAPGVYVLRLINGNDVKTQKIVVR